jgi:hypothetical protein
MSVIKVRFFLALVAGEDSDGRRPVPVMAQQSGSPLSKVV